MELVVPTVERVGSYVEALARGWSPDTLRPERADDDRAEIEDDAAAFVERLASPQAGGTVRFPDGVERPRVPGVTRWLWDGGFCGAINLRWPPGGGTELPPYVPGHIGYSVVPWKRRLGYATAALRFVLDEARTVGLAHVDLTTTADNVGSRRVIEANGGVLVAEGEERPELGIPCGLRYRIDLTC